MPPADRREAERPEPPPVFRGEVVYLYAFDVANEVRLDRAAELLPAKSAPVAGRDRPAPREVPVRCPLTVELPQPAARLGYAVRDLFTSHSGVYTIWRS
jgi:hypothetical protein